MNKPNKEYTGLRQDGDKAKEEVYMCEYIDVWVKRPKNDQDDCIVEQPCMDNQ